MHTTNKSDNLKSINLCIHLRNFKCIQKVSRWGNFFFFLSVMSSAYRASRLEMNLNKLSLKTVKFYLLSFFFSHLFFFFFQIIVALHKRIAERRRRRRKKTQLFKAVCMSYSSMDKLSLFTGKILLGRLSFEVIPV